MICMDCQMAQLCRYFGSSPMQVVEDGKPTVSVECVFKGQLPSDEHTLSAIVHVPTGFSLDRNGRVAQVNVSVHTIETKVKRNWILRWITD